MPKSPRKPAAPKAKKLPELSADRQSANVRGGMRNEPTKHPAKVTIPDLKL